MNECFLCRKEFEETTVRCKCCALPTMKDVKGNLACEHCCFILEKSATEQMKKKYGERYWEHPDFGKKT